MIIISNKININNNNNKRNLNPYALDYPVCVDDKKKYGRNQRKALINNNLNSIKNGDVLKKIKQVYYYYTR